MKIAVTPFNVDSINELSDNGADIFILGNSEYANRLVHSFTVSEIMAANDIIKSLKKEVYISLNLIVHNRDIQKINGTRRWPRLSTRIAGIIIIILVSIVQLPSAKGRQN